MKRRALPIGIAAVTSAAALRRQAVILTWSQARTRRFVK
jgi:hypothetical protein